MKHKIYFRSSEKMLDINDESVNTIITSPPYWDLKDYNHLNQIGYREKYSDYLDRLFLVWTECFRILKNDGNIFININYRIQKNQIIDIHNEIIDQMDKIGFIFKKKYIWHKPSSIPTNNYRFSDKYEYHLHFSKKEKNKFNNIFFNDYLINKEFIPDIWRIVKKAGSIGKKFEHPAIFPIELVKRSIELTTNTNDIVLDPFLGSGSTLIASDLSNRNFIGYEINKDYIELIKYRCTIYKVPLDNIEFNS